MRRRPANSISFHVMALTQMRQNTPGRAYYLRKRSQGKGHHKEAMRCLKRRLSDVVYRQLRHDAHRLGAGPGGHSGRLDRPARPAQTPHTDASDKSLPHLPKATIQPNTYRAHLTQRGAVMRHVRTHRRRPGPSIGRQGAQVLRRARDKLEEIRDLTDHGLLEARGLRAGPSSNSDNPSPSATRPEIEPIACVVRFDQVPIR